MKSTEMPNGPFIPILLLDEGEMDVARWVEFGIEEEGIPFQMMTESCLTATLIADVEQETNGVMLAHQSSLGVAVVVGSRGIQIFSRLRKDKAPLLVFQLANDGSDCPKAKLAGKNAARIVKGKPMLDIG